MRRVTSTSSHCKQASSLWNTLGRQGRKPGNRQAEKPEFVVEVKEKNGVPRASRKIIVSIDQYPAVTLCDISQIFDAFSQDCSYVLPDVLKAKVVRCFKREMRAEFHFEPGRFRRDRSSNEDSALAERGHICTPDPSQGLTPDHHTPLQVRPLVLSGGSADPPFNSLTGRKWARDRAASKDPGLKGAKSLSNRNISIASRSKHVPGSSRTPSSVEKKGVIGKFCNRMCTPTHSDVPGTSSGVVCQNIEDTCQRARAYFRKTSSSCARTDMPWPLPNSGLTRASHTATPACPAPPADPTDTVGSPIRPNNQDAQRGYTSETLGAPEGSSSGPAQCIHHKKDERRDSENGELVRNISSRSPDSTNVGFTPNSLQAETQPSPPSDGHGRESSDDVNSPLHTDHQCDHSRTPLFPFTVLSDMESTNSLYSISPSLFQSGEVRSISLVGLSSPCSLTGPLENHLFFSKDARMDSFNSSSSESSLLLPQYKRESDEEPLSSLPKLLPHFERSISDDEDNILYSLLYETCRETDNALPPILSPITSPKRPSWSPGSSYGMEPEEDTYSHEPPQLVNEKEISGVDQGSGEVLNPAPPTEPQFSPSNHNGAKRSSPSTGASDNGDQTCAYICADALDEVTAYKQDILLVDVTQDDAELFENLPQASLLNLGPVRVSEDLKCKPVKAAKKQQPLSDRLQVELGHR